VKEAPDLFEVFKKEFSSYFVTPFGYVFIGIFLLLTGIIFSIYNLSGGRGDVNGMLSILNFASIVAFPLLTMKLIADEKKTGSDKLIFTVPKSVTAIIMGKYFAALMIFIISLLLTGIFVIMIFVFGETSIESVIGSYFGFFLLGASFIAITLFASSITASQVTAAIAGFSFLLFFIILSFLESTVHIPILKSIINALSILNRYDDFTRGIIKFSSLVYYLSISILFVFFTVVSVQRKQWRRESNK